MKRNVTNDVRLFAVSPGNFQPFYLLACAQMWPIDIDMKEDVDQPTPGDAKESLHQPLKNAQQQLSYNSEHRLRSENLSWDIDVWYPTVTDFTYPSTFIPLSLDEAKAIIAFHDATWRHVRDLKDEEIFILKKLEEEIHTSIQSFPNKCAFLRMCGRSPKDGEPLDRAGIVAKYNSELEELLKSGLPLCGNTKMIAISRTPLLKIRSGSDAMSLILTSERVYSDMLDWTKYGEPEQICLRQWDDDITLEREFRVFVHGGRITGISQYDHYTYFPDLAGLKDIIQAGIFDLWGRVHDRVRTPDYVMDVVYRPHLPDKFALLEFSPFFPCTGAALFNWTLDAEVLEGSKPMEFRLKRAEDVHPQIDDLIEINWDMRWRDEFVPYYAHYEKKNQGFLSSVLSLLSRPSSVTRAEESDMLLFVYGTLKRNFQWNAKYLSPRLGARLIGHATTQDKLKLVIGDCGVPYVLADVADQTDAKEIKGEVWAVSRSCLKNLDDYEGVSKGYYDRIQINVQLVSSLDSYPSGIVLANIYVLNNAPQHLRDREGLEEYTLQDHKQLYHPIEHIQIKQRNYFKAPSTWGKTDRAIASSSVVQT
jgi:gamma-glutamylcyclotransferase (GGCT)/AIG2-like uncharacterized protein YtfP